MSTSTLLEYGGPLFISNNQCISSEGRSALLIEVFLPDN
jgi:hypothetical protein